MACKVKQILTGIMLALWRCPAIHKGKPLRIIPKMKNTITMKHLTNHPSEPIGKHADSLEAALQIKKAQKHCIGIAVIVPVAQTHSRHTVRVERRFAKALICMRSLRKKQPPVAHVEDRAMR